MASLGGGAAVLGFLYWTAPYSEIEGMAACVRVGRRLLPRCHRPTLASPSEPRRRRCKGWDDRAGVEGNVAPSWALSGRSSMVPVGVRSWREERTVRRRGERPATKRTCSLASSSGVKLW